MDMQEKVVRKALEILFGSDTGKIKFCGKLESKIGLLAEVDGIKDYRWILFRLSRCEIRPNGVPNRVWNIVVVSIGTLDGETKLFRWIGGGIAWDLDIKLSSKRHTWESPCPVCKGTGKGNHHQGICERCSGSTFGDIYMYLVTESELSD